jgi:hypothetical protein
MASTTRTFYRAATTSVVGVALALAAAAAPGQDQPNPPQMMDHGGMSMKDHAMPGHDQMPEMMQHHQQMMAMMAQRQTGALIMPGQDAFGAIQEIVRTLEADPKTDWSRVDLEALRQHLIDMNDVTLQANAEAKSIDGGLEIAVTGSGRTLAAIQRMVPAHAAEINGLNGWSAKTAMLSSGVLLTVTSKDAKEAQHIRGLGFIGLMVSGAHHQAHHIAMAKGEPVYSHATQEGARSH